jgi:hypothetical protein
MLRSQLRCFAVWISQLQANSSAARARRSISKAREDYMAQYSFHIETDGCHFDLKGASFLEEKTAEQFARRLCTFFHPKLWSPTVVMCDGDGKEVFRTHGPSEQVTAREKGIGSKTDRSTA